ncbi:3-oxoacyl-[acyl-carrier-protein] reductase FabG [Paraburkholderia sediminicola]|uniref:3-oxoacyl-[acyl-carrier-protein] reductase FabG n=1 Tax=Paraburkholderia sediminicola TaxID=458836 RepID=A0A6J5CRW9_9BURK|nr:SDR family oxidoreductase [Paraburkholderia sediminicola]CAB3741055.1 3-oxoacyl-[acyl-carrier-protein] reductase FabG [Paraburkholderia sediminicola]
MEQQLNWLGPARGSHMIVAGGCGGIGRELVAQAVAYGVDVTVLDLPGSIVPAHCIEGARYISFDARDEASIGAAISKVADQWKHVDAFVFLCGYPILPRRPLSEVSLSAWNDLMQVNLTSAYLLTNALLPLLRESEWPSITTVASSLGYQVMPGMGAYATSKGALVSLTKALAMELAPKIRVNAVAPGAVETEFLGGGTGREELGNDRTWFDAMSDKYVSAVPLGRVAAPSDVAGPILFLAGRGAAYMTGQVLHLNGGRLTP